MNSIIQTDYVNRPVVATTAHGLIAGLVGRRDGIGGICLTTHEGAVFWPHEITDVRTCTRDEAARIMLQEENAS